MRGPARGPAPTIGPGHGGPRAGYRLGMADREHTKQPVEELRAVDAGAVPDEEGVSDASAAETLDVAAEEHVNRPDQPDFDPDERAQYDHPRVETAGPGDESAS